VNTFPLTEPYRAVLSAIIAEGNQQVEINSAELIGQFGFSIMLDANFSQGS